MTSATPASSSSSATTLVSCDLDHPDMVGHLAPTVPAASPPLPLPPPPPPLCSDGLPQHYHYPQTLPSDRSASTVGHSRDHPPPGAPHMHPGPVRNGYAAHADAPPGGPLMRHTGLLGWFERAALHTTPSYYATTMGTGIASILLHNFPYGARWLQYLGTITFVLNVVAFVVISVFTLARYVCWTGMWRVVLKHNVASMFWGCLPMGATTIVNMICFVCVPVWGRPWAYLAYGLWWADILVSIYINFGMLFILFTRQQQTERTLAPTWLLPIVTSVVAAASGAVVSQALLPFNPTLARTTIFAAYCVWGTGVPVAMMVITLVLYRMAIHGPPEGTSLASVFLPLGPCGQGSYGIIMMGTVLRQLTYDYNTPVVPGLGLDESRRVADAMFAGGLVVGLVLWGLALVWYVLATAMFLDGWRRDWTLLGPGKFAVGLWGLTFPIGVFATSTIALSTELRSPAFKVIAAFLSAQVILHWLFVGVSTLWKAVDGSLFAAPELIGIDDDSGAVRRRRSPSPPNVRVRWAEGKDGDVEAARGGRRS